MDAAFAEIGISVIDFAQISAGFLLAMLCLFGLRARRHARVVYFTLSVYALQCLLIITLRDGLPVKLFAALMPTTVLIVEVFVGRRRRLSGAESRAAGPRG